MRLRLIILILPVLFILTAAGSFASPAPFGVIAAPGALAGSWIYTLSNHDTTGEVLPYGLDLDWPEGQASLFSISGTPTGWVIYTESTGPSWSANTTNEPTAGHSLSGFEVAGVTAPPTIFTVWYTVGIDDNNFQGNVDVVPEPAGVVSLLAGLSGLYAFMRRRR